MPLGYLEKMSNILQWLHDNALSLITLIITPILAWFFNLRKEITEEQKVDSDTKRTYAEGTNLLVNSSGEVIKSWQEFASEMKKEYTECKENNLQLSKKVDNTLSYVQKLQRYSDGITSLLVDILVELEKINPELAKQNREKLEKIKQSFQEVENNV